MCAAATAHYLTPSAKSVRALASVFPDDAIVVVESPTATQALRNQLRIGRPGSYYFSAGGGLGFGLRLDTPWQTTAGALLACGAAVSILGLVREGPRAFVRSESRE